MELHEYYSEINSRIEKIDFDALWKDFKPLKFALYNDKKCFFDGQYIEKTDDFFANTAIEFNGEVIAIWNVTDGFRCSHLENRARNVPRISDDKRGEALRR